MASRTIPETTTLDADPLLPLPVIVVGGFKWEGGLWLRVRVHLTMGSGPLLPLLKVSKVMTGLSRDLMPTTRHPRTACRRAYCPANSPALKSSVEHAIANCAFAWASLASQAGFSTCVSWCTLEASKAASASNLAISASRRASWSSCSAMACWTAAVCLACSGSLDCLTLACHFPTMLCSLSCRAPGFNAAWFSPKFLPLHSHSYAAQTTMTTKTKVDGDGWMSSF